MLNSLLFASSFFGLLSEPLDTSLTAPVELESVTIVSQSSKSSHISGAEIILTAAELQRFDIQDGNTLLQSQPGVFTQQEDGWGLRLNIGIRGTGVDRSSRITLMEDGVLTAPAAYSAPAAYYSPVLWKYEQLEILKGGAALITGPQSTGGAINFVSPTPKKKDFTQIKLSGGSYGSRIGNVTGQVQILPRGQFIYGFQQSQAAGFNEMAGNRTGGFNLSDGFIKFIQHLDDKDRHHLEVFVAGTRENSSQTYLGMSKEDATVAPNTRYIASSDDAMQMNRLMTRIGYTYNRKKGWFRADLYRQNVHRNWYKIDQVSDGTSPIKLADLLMNPVGNSGYFDALRGINSLGYTALLKANNRYYLSQGLQLKGLYNQKLGIFYLKHETGIRLHYDDADRFQHIDTYAINNNGLELTSNGTPGSAGNRVDFTHAQSGYYRITSTYKSWNLQVGSRMEHIQSFRNDFGSSDSARIGINLKERQNATWTLLPGISISKHIGRWKAFLGLHTGMTPAGSAQGVLPEKSLNAEIGIKHSTIPINMVLYRSDYNRLLGSDAASSGGSGTGDLYNGGAAKVTGLEFQYTKNIKKLTAQFTGTITEAIFTESFSSDFDSWGDVTQGDLLPYLPIYQGSLSLFYESNSWTLSTGLNLSSGRKTTAAILDFDLPKFMVMNLSALYKLNEITSFKISGQNLTNSRHIVAARPAGYRTFSPRMLVLGIQLSL